MAIIEHGYAFDLKMEPAFFGQTYLPDRFIGIGSYFSVEPLICSFDDLGIIFLSVYYPSICILLPDRLLSGNFQEEII